MEFEFSSVHETIAATIPEREAIVYGDRRLTYGELGERSRRLASFLAGRGLGCHRERARLANHESGQDHLALYLFENSRSRAMLYHAEFAPRVAAVRERLPQLELLIQVADDSGNALLPGAVDYEEALAATSSALPGASPSPDDLYLLYTGGTTGMPKGVLWRSADIFVAAMGGRRLDGAEYGSLEEIAANAKAGGTMRTLIGPPLMHGAAQWASFINMCGGNTLVFSPVRERFDAAAVLATIDREKVGSVTIVGDAFARPMLDELERGGYDLSSLKVIGSGGAPLSTAHKKALLERLPQVMVMDAIGSSETGAQGSNPASRGGAVSTGDFRPLPGACVVSEDLSRLLQPGDDEMGWFAQTGRVPLGYLGDAEKTARTFPVIEGVRYAVPGDRARYRQDGGIEVLGRDSVTINSGGEKIFAEEVEHALKQHPDVWDAVVTGRPSERWGQEVVAVVQLRAGAGTAEDELLAEAGRHVARYKLPKAFVFRERIERSPSGKADYRWAREQAREG